MTFDFDKAQFNEMTRLIQEVLVKLGCDGVRQCPYPSAADIAAQILQQFKEKSFPVLPALPVNCRNDNRLIATVYFRRGGHSLDDANCMVVPDDRDNTLLVEGTKRGDVDTAKSCNDADSAKLSTLERKLRTSVSSRIGTSDQILVVGYTDSTGPVSSNINISNGRARSVAEALRKKDSISAIQTQISAIGRSEVAQAGEF